VPRSGYDDDAILVNKHTPSQLMILFVRSRSSWNDHLRIRIFSCECLRYEYDDPLCLTFTLPLFDFALALPFAIITRSTAVH